MSRMIRRAAVIGSGVMGSGIAAHLANSGIACLLLDIVPETLTAEEAARGLNLTDTKVRNRLAVSAVAGLRKTHPAPLYDSAFSELITAGNIEDNLEQLKEVDWIIEVVVEDLAVKRSLLEKIESNWQEGTIVSSNTSGISINEMVRGRSKAFKRHFLGTHFFNPPRYLKLLEIIPGEETDPAIVDFMSSFCNKALGKGVVKTKDTPNFIGNRIGTYGLLVTLQEMREAGCSVDEVDAVTGPALGRPKSATLRTLDVVGLDTFVHVAQNVHDHVADEGEKAVFNVPEYVREMVARGWNGAKRGQGFYKSIPTKRGKEILALDIDSMEYQPRRKIDSETLARAGKIREAGERIRTLINGEHRYARLAWNATKKVLLYSAEKLDEISDSIVEIDRAMKWGFNWELGPFEIWDAIGLEASVSRMEAEGLAIPEWVKQWITAGNHSFYKWQNGRIYHFQAVADAPAVQHGDRSEAYSSDVGTHSRRQRYAVLEQDPESISLRSLKERNPAVLSNRDASLIDLGAGVACLEFHSPNNAIGDGIIEMIEKSMEEVRRGFKGLVIANEGKNFCVGADLKLLLGSAEKKDWPAIDKMIQALQSTLLRLKYFEKPVVAAPHQMTLGGGVEICLAADQVNPAAETYAGLVETGVGLIPAGGGCKEMAVRAAAVIKGYPEADLQPFINRPFEMIGAAKVSASAYEAKNLGWLRKSDRVIANRDHLVYEAKKTVLSLDALGYAAPREEKIKVVGENGKALLLLGADHLRRSGYISDYDRTIAGKLAHILSGGNVPPGASVTEQYLLDLEREAFLSLCGETKTQDRIRHMLVRGKPLRN